MVIEMEIRRIIISEIHEHQVVVLQEVGGVRSFPIIIGLFEATSIDRRVKKIESPRPLTHDLVVNAVEHLGGSVHSIVINELIDNTYYAKIVIRKDGRNEELDCRPSDAIAIAATADVPIYVEEEVLEMVEAKI
jgi:uncharacterized protein